MLVLDSATRSIEVVLGSAHTTNPLVCFATWRDIDATTYTPSLGGVNTNGTTPVAAVPAPAAGKQRVIDTLSVYNNDTVAKDVTVRFNDGGTNYILTKINLGPGERLQYAEGEGFNVANNQGAIKTSNNQGAAPITSGWQSAVLSADVVNNNATANTIQDVTGLSFPVTAGQRYHFKFIIPYTAAATTTGSRWTINGPAFSLLAYRSDYTLTTTTRTINEAVAYDTPAASNASSAATTGNYATIEGFIIPSADGTVIARFASEITASAITAKAGAMVQWMQV